LYLLWSCKKKQPIRAYAEHGIWLYSTPIMSIEVETKKKRKKKVLKHY
jgi:hypothetical protein